ncbi:MAG: hypothetical protein QOD75_3086 [Blastocatellia bacterium]|jgi:hemerythrin superfamily protein|nr:hypothetical protein [Blastocatellia bacterium]
MDAFQLLKADHKKVAKLFKQLEAASGKAKLSIFQNIKGELDLHAHIEEKFLYPALEKPEETHDLTLEAYEEHQVVKTLLAELSGAKAADDEWQARVKVLQENVEHHVQEEENELFDKADDALSDEEIEDLGNKMEAEKARETGQPVPKQVRANRAAGKANKGEPGILSKIADFVGLGSSASDTKTAKKRPVKRTSPPKSSKASAKGESKQSAGKTKSAAATKQSTKGKGSKRFRPAKSASSATKKSGTRSRKKASKK